jgi:ATP-dependent RNA helicase RhlE
MGNYSQGRRSSRPSALSTKSSSSSRNSYHSGGNRNRSSTKRRFGQTIDPKRFVKPAKPTELENYVPVNTFRDFNLNEVLQTNLESKGYTHPSQVQDSAIKPALEGRDIIGIANTGTGKTAAFLLPIITKLMANRGQKVLIIAPTRELALQIQQESREFAKGGRLYDAILIGGTPMNRQIRDLQRNPEIIIGTPGRIKDHIERGTLKLHDVSTIVLDEVDRMLDMGFIIDIREILSKLPETRQSLFFSATLEPRIESLVRTFTKDPVTIMARTAETSDNVDQSIMHYFEKTDKMDKLHDLLVKDEVSKTLIFCETKRGSEALSKELVSRGFTADAIHGNKSQGQRQRALSKFKDSHVEILVATDVAARGIDVKDITHVINFDIPQTYDDYTHRIGRTGRAGTTGYAVTFVTH